MKKINLMAPINYLGYGIVGRHIFLELNKTADVTLFPIGGPQETSQENIQTIQSAVAKQNDIAKNCTAIKIWHEHSLAERPPCNKFIGFPIFELDTLHDRAISHMKSCDEIFVCSRWARDVVYDQFGVTGHAVNIIPLGVDRTIFHENYDDPENNKCRFFTCGKWEIRKGHDVLLKVFQTAFPNNEDVELHMMCQNDFPQAAKFVQQMQQYYTSDPRVNLVPRVNTHQEVALVMSQMDCGVFLSRAEGWNLELLEMMSMGKHVIATNYSAHTEFCDTNNCMLVDITDKEAAFDGVWFDGKIGKWAAIEEQQIEQAASHMKSFYETWKTNKSQSNTVGISTAKEFNWEKTASLILERV